MTRRGLEPTQIEQFITGGFVRIDAAFPQTLAGQARDILWKDTGCDPGNPATWTKPVIRLGMYTQFMVHAAQPHHGTRPRFLAQPPLLPTDLENRPSEPLSAVEVATQRSLETGS